MKSTKGEERLDLLDRIEHRLRESRLALHSQHDFPVLLNLLDQNRRDLLIRHVCRYLWLPPKHRDLVYRLPAYAAHSGSYRPVVRNRPIAAHDRRRSQVWRNSKYRACRASHTKPLGELVPKCFCLAFSVIDRMPLRRCRCRRAGFRDFVVTRGAGRRFKVLSQQRWPGRRLAGLEIAPAILNGSGAGGRYCYWGLIGRKDEGRTLGDNFAEAGGALPTPREGADTVDAANIGHGGKTVGDGRSATLGWVVSSHSFLSFLFKSVHLPPTPQLWPFSILAVAVSISAASKQWLVLELNASVSHRGETASSAGRLTPALVLVPGCWVSWRHSDGWCDLRLGIVQDRCSVSLWCCCKEEKEERRGKRGGEEKEKESAETITKEVRQETDDDDWRRREDHTRDENTKNTTHDTHTNKPPPLVTRSSTIPNPTWRAMPNCQWLIWSDLTVGFSLAFTKSQESQRTGLPFGRVNAVRFQRREASRDFEGRYCVLRHTQPRRQAGVMLVLKWLETGRLESPRVQVEMGINKAKKLRWGRWDDDVGVRVNDSSIFAAAASCSGESTLSLWLFELCKVWILGSVFLRSSTRGTNAKRRKKLGKKGRGVPGSLVWVWVFRVSLKRRRVETWYVKGLASFWRSE